MNRKRNIVIVSAIGIVALMLTNGWNMFAEAAWPPDPMPVYSLAGAWIETSDLDQPGNITIVTISPEDPRTGTGFAVATEINTDPTIGGSIPNATSLTALFVTYVKTGPNTFQANGVFYVRKDEKPRPVILGIIAVENTITQTSPDTMEAVGTFSLYSSASDKDGDGLPDVDEQPLWASPITQHLKRI
jgi:hypothetical protein